MRILPLRFGGCCAEGVTRQVPGASGGCCALAEHRSTLVGLRLCRFGSCPKVFPKAQEPRAPRVPRALRRLRGLAGLQSEAAGAAGAARAPWLPRPVLAGGATEGF